jgi:hypothetical protein
MIPSPPKAPPEPCCTAKHATAVIFPINYERATTETAGHQFFQKVLPECNAPPASSWCAFWQSRNARCSVLRINPNLLRANESGSSQHILLCLQAENAPRSSSWMLPAVDSSTASN